MTSSPWHRSTDLHYGLVINGTLSNAQNPRLVWRLFCGIASAVNDTENRILETLLELESTVNNLASTGARPNLVPLFSKLDEFAAQLPAGSDPELRHFLQRKSYQKARLLLQGRGAENRRGSCGH